jgi:hypothetical protein
MQHLEPIRLPRFCAVFQYTAATFGAITIANSEVSVFFRVVVVRWESSAEWKLVVLVA